MQQKQDRASILNSWRQEKESAYLYRILVTQSTETPKQQLFSQLAQEAEEQAEIWAKTFRETTSQAVPEFHPGWRIIVVKRLIIWFGPERIRTILSATKVRGMSIYNLSVGHPMPEHISDVGQRHQSSGAGNNMRAAVFGINDGLISNTSLILGMAGGHAAHNTILLAGIAGLLAGAFSMAAGEFISVRSQREMLEYQIEQERKELELYPAEEAAELSLIYQARGLSQADAEHAANTILQNPEHALNTLAREELGLDPEKLVSPYGAAIFSFVSFMVGAGVPLLPFVFNITSNTIVLTVVLSAMALFIIGAILSLFTGRNAIKNGLRMLSIGAIAGVLTYLIGYGISQGLS